MQETKTIIVGGGMAGISCAMKLLGAGEDFLLVTDNLGADQVLSEREGQLWGVLCNEQLHLRKKTSHPRHMDQSC